MAGGLEEGTRGDLGRSVRADAAYLALAAGDRHYWERGENHALGEGDRALLRRRAEEAAAYAGADPWARSGPADHGAVVHSVSRFVGDGMPVGNIEGNPSPRRPLSWILSTGVGGAGSAPPPDTGGRPGWVCINAATFAAALLRELGYPARECNVLLARAGNADDGWHGAMYQEAALQVWFDRAWHWLDPYLGIYDPAATRDDASRYKADAPYHWAGRSAPASWRPWVDRGWLRFAGGERVGCDLQRRFGPPGVDGRGCEVLPAADARVSRPTSAGERPGGTSTPGVFIHAVTEGATLSLRDSAERVTGPGRREIPGSVHIPAGMVVPYSSDGARPAAFGELESVFFGTASLLGGWDEVRRHDLTLEVSAPAARTVDLLHTIVPGEHAVTARGLPDAVPLAGGRAAVPFSVTIHPVNDAFHAAFELLLRSGVVSAGMYWPAVDRMQALRLQAPPHP